MRWIYIRISEKDAIMPTIDLKSADEIKRLWNQGYLLKLETDTGTQKDNIDKLFAFVDRA